MVTLTVPPPLTSALSCSGTKRPMRLAKGAEVCQEEVLEKADQATFAAPITAMANGGSSDAVFDVTCDAVGDALFPAWHLRWHRLTLDEFAVWAAWV
jgi:hypothetical protein